MQLGEEFFAIEPGYHTNKKHWNTLQLYSLKVDEQSPYHFVNGITEQLPQELIRELMDHSYVLVVDGGTPQQKQALTKRNDDQT